MVRTQMPKKTKMPKTIVVYVCDYEDRDPKKPIYGVADGGVDSIPSDAKGEPVGIYKLESEGKLEVIQKLSS